MARKLSARAERKADKQAQLWAAKYAAAATPADVAALEFDRTRAAIGDLPPRQAEKAWKRLAEVMARHRDTIEVTPSDVHE